MKICFIANANHTNTSNWVEFFANELDHEVSIISFDMPNKPLKNVKLFKLEGLFSKGKMRYFSCVPQVRRLIKKLHPEVIVGYRVHSYGLTAALSGCHPLVLAAQGQNIYFPFDSRFSKFCAQFAIKRADLINSWGEHMTTKLLELGCPAAKVLTMPRGVKIDLFVPRKTAKDGDVYLVSTRSLREHYQLDIIIKALRIVRDKGVLINYNLVGDGPYKGDLKQLTERLELQSEVNFVGFIENAKLPEVLNRSDIYVSMVRTDGVSASLLEAMACGLFPIVTDNVANRIWIEDGKNDYLIPESNVSILAERICDAASRDSLRKEAGKMNRSLVEEKGNWAKNMKVMEMAYLKLTAERTR